MKTKALGLAISAASIAAVWAWPNVALESKVAAHFVAVLCWAGLGLGALLLASVGVLCNSKWYDPLLPMLRILMLSVPIQFLLFVPIFIAWPRTHGFVQAPELPLPEVLVQWLSAPAWACRAALYWCVWCALALMWQRSSGPRIAVVTAVSMAITLSLSAVDWIMSLAAPWQSSVLGVYLVAGAMVAGISGAAVGTLGGMGRERRVSTSVVWALARLLFTLNFFWAYLAVTQALIVYMGDLPDEVPWFLARVRGAYAFETFVLAVGHFVLPCGVFLFERLKRHAGVVMIVGAVSFIVHAVDVHWLVIPSIRSAPVPMVAQLLAFVGVGLCTVVGLRLRSRA